MQRMWLIRELDQFLLLREEKRKKNQLKFQIFQFKKKILSEKNLYFYCATLVSPPELRP